MVKAANRAKVIRAFAQRVLAPPNVIVAAIRPAPLTADRTMATVPRRVSVVGGHEPLGKSGQEPQEEYKLEQGK